MENLDKEESSKSFNLRDRLKNEFSRENISLNFEKNFQLMKKDPEEVIKLNLNIFYLINIYFRYLNTFTVQLFVKFLKN